MKEKPSIHFFVSPYGNDRWSGGLPAPNKSRTDGPFAAIGRAQRAVRRLKVKGELPTTVRVALRGGLYQLRRPLVFMPEDSGHARTDEWNRPIGPKRDITYSAHRGETPILSGGQRITGWRETRVNGRRAWVIRLPDVAQDRWYFTQLWVNNRRALRTRLPKAGYFRIEKLLGEIYWKGDIHQVLFTGQDRFRFARSDLRAWRNVRDIEFVALHFWIESRVPLAGINAKTREARLQWKTRMRLSDDHGREGVQYYVENIFEELKEPGQWYLDRPSGELCYLPLPNERIQSSEIFAPRLAQLMILQGDEEKGRMVEHLHFEGITFSHSEWAPGAEARRATPQAACHIPGALSFRQARHCGLRNCSLSRLGSYGLELGEGSTDIEITGNRITDLAGGGVKVWHTPERGAKGNSRGCGPDLTFERGCSRILITDNEIADGGHRWRQAVGVLIGKCSGNQVLHNHIHDFDYTGVSVGWTWGYAEGHAYGNVIEHNHIHDIGRGVLSDMGAIYMLGVSPGTRIRSNLIHDVESRGYGGFGIYTDEGSSDILIENNIVHHTRSHGFCQHYGRNNMVRNNIFAFGGEGGIVRSRLEQHDSFYFHHNILLFDNDGRCVGGANFF